MAIDGSAHPCRAGQAEQPRSCRGVALHPAAIAMAIVEQVVGAPRSLPCSSSGSIPNEVAPRRMKAASTKSWLRSSPPSGGRPGIHRQAFNARRKAATR